MTYVESTAIGKPTVLGEPTQRLERQVLEAVSPTSFSRATSTHPEVWGIEFEELKI